MTPVFYGYIIRHSVTIRSFLYDSKIGSDRKAGERKRYLSVR